MNLVSSKRPIFLSRAQRRNRAGRAALAVLIATGAGVCIMGAIYIAGYYIAGVMQ